MAQFLTFINLRGPCLNAASHKRLHLVVSRSLAAWEIEIMDFTKIYHVATFYLNKVATQPFEYQEVLEAPNFKNGSFDGDPV